MLHQKTKFLGSKFILLALTALSLSTTGCDLARNQLKPDRDGGMEMQDYRDGLAPRLPDIEEGKAEGAGAIPELQSYIAENDPNSKPMPLVSISVNQTVPLRDVLFELAQQADYDIELDPRINGSIIFTAREKPFDQVVERICTTAGLRYKFQDDTLRVELDTPYNKVYKIDYLSYIRSNKGSVRNDIGVVKGEGADTGSSYQATSESEANFWGELEVNVQQILNSAPGAVLKTKRDPRITATEQNPEVQAVAPTDTSGNVQVNPPEAVLRVESLPTEEEEAAGSSGGSGQQQDPLTPTFTLNKQAGLVNVYASEHAHKEIEQYLKMVRKAVTAQVLIEAKILEVTLNDEFATGIDWRILNGLSGELAVNYLTETGSDLLDDLGPSTVPLAPGTSFADGSNFVLGYAGNDVQAVIRAISGFGTVRALASPRLTVLNNQSAILNVANNRVFFDIDIDVTTDEGVSQVDIDSDIRNVPEGVLVNVQPSINLENGTVSMAVRPTITTVIDTKADPAIQLIAASADPPLDVESLVPELNVREIDSVIQVRSGQPFIMGGLLQDKVTNNQEGIPVASEIPVVGNLFKQHVDLVQKTELIIFLKATILAQPEDSVHDTDRDLYRTFSGDRRPLKL